MNLRDYAQKQKEAQQDFTQQEVQGATIQNNNPIAAAQEIIYEYKINREIAESCRLQILQDIERKENPYTLLLLAAEAISRLEFKGDTFFLQVRNKLIEVYGYDVSQDPPEQP